MKKLVVVVASTVFAATLVALLAIPYWLGIEIENAFRNRLGALARDSGLILKNEGFQRGWLSSRAHTLLQAPGIPIEVSAEHVIHHGLFRFDRWLAGDVALTPMRAQIETRGILKVIVSTSSASVPFTLDTIVAYNGEGHTHLRSPTIQGTRDHGVAWLGLTGDVRFDSALHHIRAELHAPRVGYGLVEIVDIRLASDIRKGAADHYLGKASIRIDKVSIGPMLQAKQLGIVTESSVQGSDLKILASYDVHDIRTPNGKFGPGKLVLEVRKLDALTLARFQQEMNTLQKGDRPKEQVDLIRVGKVMQLVGELAKKSPEFEITELRLGVDGEEISGKAKLVLDGSKSNLTQNPLLILTAAAGEAEVLLPPALLKPLLLPLLLADLEDYRRRGLVRAEPMTSEQMAVILDQALPIYISRHQLTRRLVHESGRYRLSASLRRGQVLVNGEPLNVPGASVLPQLQ